MSPLYPQPGTVLAERYRVGSVIGRGGMGVVLEAQNTVTQRRVAIKWILGDPSDSHEASERLIREASAASLVSHPNVVDVYDVLRDGSAIFLVMELLKGEPLSALLRRGGMPLPQLIALIIPAMRGVAEAHRLGIVHRDVHPGNIFIAQEGHDRRLVPKVLDFGISKLASDRDKHLTRSNICMGTPLYMSYEQLCSARDVDHRTDIYSFGVVLYEAVTGRRPYDGESVFEVAGKVATGAPVHPKQLRPEIPSALAELVMWAMAGKREERIATLESLIAELEPFASQNAFRAQMTDANAPVPAVLARQTSAGSAAPAADAPQAPHARTSRAAPVGAAETADASAAATTAPPLLSLPTASAKQPDVDTLGRVNTPLANSLRVRSAATVRSSIRIAAVAAIGALLFAGGVWYASSSTQPREVAGGSVTPRAEAAPPPIPAPVATDPRAVGVVDPGAEPSPAPTKPVVVQPSLPTPPRPQQPGTQPAQTTTPTVPLWKQRLLLQKQQQRQQQSASVQTKDVAAARPVDESGFRAGPMRPEDMFPQ